MLASLWAIVRAVQTEAVCETATMNPKELAAALTSKPITPTRLAKFATHIHGTGNGARQKRDDSFARDTLAAIEASHGVDVKEQAEKALTR